ncbi:MAG: hypothetical protein K2N94_16375, partial [Lachnospiraceae bacterium]|nr:hypothetical protein [Lachnospiraceae bacterium]
SCEGFADLAARPSFLRLRGQESLNSLHHVSLLAVRQQEVCAAAQTCMEFAPDYPEQAAGLAYMYDAMNFYLLVKTADENGRSLLTLLKSDDGVITDEAEPIPVARDGRLELRAVVSQDGLAVRFYFRQTEQEEGKASLQGLQPDLERALVPEEKQDSPEPTWQQVGESLSTQLVTDEHCRGFTGAHFGMYVHDMTGLSYHADFDYFEVKYDEECCLS